MRSNLSYNPRSNDSCFIFALLGVIIFLMATGIFALVVLHMLSPIISRLTNTW